ncbi:MAG: L,D-transpeptidase family protein [Anaerolineae bacterium]|nr:L,D-transpeptidase family protein [Anaerolineae bacterium]
MPLFAQRSRRPRPRRPGVSPVVPARNGASPRPLALPNGAVPRPMVPPVPHPAPRRRRRARRLSTRGALLLGMAFSLIATSACLLALVAGLGVLIGSGQVLPGVSAAGVDLGGMSEREAAEALAAAWDAGGLLLRDGERVWAVDPVALGVTLDADATAAAARAWGRSQGGLGGIFEALAGGVDVAPVVRVDTAALTAYLEEARAGIELPPVNAGVRLVNGRAVASPPADGRTLDVAATVARMSADAPGELADGALDLVMAPVGPAIRDASPLLAQANALLSSPFELRGYDPIRDEWHTWSAPPDVWAAWLTAEPDASSATGLRLAANPDAARAFAETSARFADERYVDAEEAVSAVQRALAQSAARATVRVRHGETVYEVRGGQTLAAIAEEIGIPYPYIQAANPGVNTNALSVGQRLTIPSLDILVPLEPVAHKRIVVSRSQQHLWAYENGQVVFDWVISTGLPTSPTALGVFQVQTHDPNAYADQWNLYMPHFMGFYHPGPNMDLWNGFHGFPTRGGGYLLWTGDLGRPVTYGCVLLSLENAAALYEWAEDGVIVEMRG